MEIEKSKGPRELLNWADIQKMKYSWNVAREVMRLAPCSRYFQRTNQRFTYNGSFIPKGWKVTKKNPFQCFTITYLIPINYFNTNLIFVLKNRFYGVLTQRIKRWILSGANEVWSIEIQGAWTCSVHIYPVWWRSYYILRKRICPNGNIGFHALPREEV